jgi:hypothetical protein
VRTRVARRVAVVATGAFVSLLVTAGPVLAKTKPDDGEGHQSHDLSTLGVIVRFVVIPLGAFLIIAGLSVLPSALSKPRYRPGKPWDHEARWIGGAPADAAAAAATATDPTARGGASAEW